MKFFFFCREVVKLLLQHEASTNIVDAKGSSPLHLAAWSGNSEIVRLILTQGPSVPNVNLTVIGFSSLSFITKLGIKSRSAMDKRIFQRRLTFFLIKNFINFDIVIEENSRCLVLFILNEKLRLNSYRIAVKVRTVGLAWVRKWLWACEFESPLKLYFSNSKWKNLFEK